MDLGIEDSPRGRTWLMRGDASPPVSQSTRYEKKQGGDEAIEGAQIRVRVPVPVSVGAWRTDRSPMDADATPRSTR
jgi:hypothetical protein